MGREEVIPKRSLSYFSHLLVFGDLRAEREVVDGQRLDGAVARVVIVMGVRMRAHLVGPLPSVTQLNFEPQFSLI